MEIGASFVAGSEPFELVQPGEGALDHPEHLAQSGAVGDAASGDQRFDATLPQQAAVTPEGRRTAYQPSTYPDWYLWP